MIKLSDARTALRTRIRDTTTTYEFSDSELSTYVEPAIREVAAAVREVDPDFYLTSQTYAGYTDALDPGTYEKYPLPKNHIAIRWIERSDVTPAYRLFEASARDQEDHRLATRWGAITASITNSSDAAVSIDLPRSGCESVVILGTHFRVIPPPTAAGPTYRVWFDADVAYPVVVGESEYINVPPAFHESLLRSWEVRVLEDDGDPIAVPKALALRGNPQTGDIGELGRAKKEQGRRRGRSITVAPAW